MSDEDMRERFEAWADTIGYDVGKNRGGNYFAHTQAAWVVWQAAWTAAREGEKGGAE